MHHDVLIIGGGAAGMSAALVLGRARRRVVLFDAAQQSNRAAGGIGGLLGHDGLPPDELYRRGREELERYPTVRVEDRRVEAVEGEAGAFAAEGYGGAHVLLAGGMDYLRPALPGVEELWGGDVFHCPFCHGWEVRDRPLAVLGSSPAAPFQALLLRGWSDDVVLLADGPAGALDDDARRDLAAAGVPIDERPVRALVAEGGRLRAIVFTDGDELPRGGLLLHTPLRLRDDLPTRLGCELTEQGGIRTDDWGRTSVPGVWAAGDTAEPAPAIAPAIATGMRAAAGITHDLLVRRPVPAAPPR